MPAKQKLKAAAAAEAALDLNAKTFAFWQRLERQESGNSNSGGPDKAGATNAVRSNPENPIILNGIGCTMKYFPSSVWFANSK